MAARPVVLVTASRELLPAGGASVAVFLAAGFVVRAVTHAAGFVDPAVRQGLDGLTTLLYCTGLGYALLGLMSARLTPVLHLGAAGLCAGALLHAALGASPVGLALSALGGGLLMLAMGREARRVETGAPRAAVLIAATGPALFAVHAVVFPAGGDLLAARFLRLGATAAMALPLLAMRYRTDHPQDASRATRVARILFAVGMLALPLTLVLSAFVDARAKYALGPASDCFTVALLIACVQAWRRGDRPALAGFGTVLASMLLGKAMGFYAFEGPLPAPAALSAYADAWRVSLRNFHIDVMVLGYTFLMWPALVRARVLAVVGVALMLALAMPALGAWSWLAGVAIAGWVIIFWRGRVAA